MTKMSIKVFNPFILFSFFNFQIFSGKQFIERRLNVPGHTLTILLAQWTHTHTHRGHLLMTTHRPRCSVLSPCANWLRKWLDLTAVDTKLTRAGHLGLAVLQWSSKSYFQSILTIKISHSWASPIKKPTLSQIANAKYVLIFFII